MFESELPEEILALVLKYALGPSFDDMTRRCQRAFHSPPPAKSVETKPPIRPRYLRGLPSHASNVSYHKFENLAYC